jgi:hypothetical protein
MVSKVPTSMKHLFSLASVHDVDQKEFRDIKKENERVAR